MKVLNIPIPISVRLNRVYVVWTVVASISNTVLVPTNILLSPEQSAGSTYTSFWSLFFSLLQLSSTKHFKNRFTAFTT